MPLHRPHDRKPPGSNLPGGFHASPLGHGMRSTPPCQAPRRYQGSISVFVAASSTAAMASADCFSPPAFTNAL